MFKTKLIVQRPSIHLGSLFNSLLTEAIFVCFLTLEAVEQIADSCKVRWLNKKNPTSISSSSTYSMILAKLLSSLSFSSPVCKLGIIITTLKRGCEN